MSGTLSIELTEPTESIAATLSNQRTTSTAAIKRVSFTLNVFENGEARDLTANELNRVVLELPILNLRGSGAPVEHRAPNGKWFTVRDLAAAIAETETTTREQSQWFGGTDVHHTFFEGIEKRADGVWEISWGS
ncbi:hypothetical protein [Nocardia heshunensis]